MSGVTPREAQAHVDKGGEVEEILAYSGNENDASHMAFASLPNQDTPRPQWRLVPIPEPTVTIEVPKSWVEAVASRPDAALSHVTHYVTAVGDNKAVRRACIKAVES